MGGQHAVAKLGHLGGQHRPGAICRPHEWAYSGCVVHEEVLNAYLPETNSS